MLWKEEYKIGVTNIDNQHKLLFDRLDLLLFELAKNDKEHSRAECLKAIEYIKILSVKHFADEEMFQRSIQYSGIHTHKKEYEIFTVCIIELIFQKICLREIAILLQCYLFPMRWLFI